MKVLYTSANESPAIIDLDQLLANFRMSGTKVYEDDIRDQLDGLGWYENFHDYGKYLILDYTKIGLEPGAALFSRYQESVNTSPLPSVARTMKAAGFAEQWTGGGCRAWEKRTGNGGYLWVCDEGNGLGDRIDELYLVGHYGADHELLAEDSVENLNAALAWCETRTQ